MSEWVFDAHEIIPIIIKLPRRVIPLIERSDHLAWAREYDRRMDQKCEQLLNGFQRVNLRSSSVNIEPNTLYSPAFKAAINNNNSRFLNLNAERNTYYMNSTIRH
jgi:hypothetical protein